MFYSQPLATRFGTDLIGALTSGQWKRLDIAVAWVRASGITHLEPALTNFLKKGNALNVVCGVDLDNTSREGLEGLLRIQKAGTASLFIHHNESGTVFHPKLYLFTNKNRAKIIVGSNNVTEAGLYRNTEAGLEVDTDITDPLVVSVSNALKIWCDTSTGLAKVLDSTFLKELVDAGYVKDEAAVRAEIAKKRASSGVKSGKPKKLFGSISVSPPPKPTTATAVKTAATSGAAKKAAAPALSSTPASAQGQVLLMRVRKARGTQVQIPLAVMNTPFFKGATKVRHTLSGVMRGINPTYATRAGAGSNPNTLKLEMPETEKMADPVARFERTDGGIEYEAYDSSSAQGQIIMDALKAGRATTPPTTTLTLPTQPSRSTWWRFI